ncbi:MAG: PAS domain S-box protein [Anaerolineales bacterium]|nr:PAS domain S-box protein [Anaerolineales bacterium]
MESQAGQNKHRVQILKEFLKSDKEHIIQLLALIPDIVFSCKVGDDGSLQPEWIIGDWKRITGYTQEEFDACGSWANWIHPDDIPIVLEHNRRLLTGEDTISEYRIIRADGENCWLQDHSHPILDETSGKITHILGTVEDITKIMRAEERLERQNFVLRTIRTVNQFITKEKDREKLIRGACKLLVENRSYYGAWIALLDETGELAIMAEAGLGDEFRGMQKELESGQQVYCVEKCLKLDGVQIIEHPRDKCGDCPLINKDTNHSGLSIRLEYNGMVYGLMSVSMPFQRVVDQEEQSMIREIAGDLAFALRNIEVETERQKAEHDLRQSTERERLLADILEKAHLPMGVGYPDGQLGICNRAFCELTGYTMDELQTVDWSRTLTPPEWLPLEEKALSELDYTKGPVRYEKEYIRKDGSRTPVELFVHLIEDETGNPQYYYAFVTDITERRRAEKVLRDSEARFRSALDNMMEGCQIIGFDWRYIYINDAAEIHNQRPKEELLGNKYMEMWPGIEETEVFNRILRCLEERVSDQMENLFVFPDGSKGWFDLRMHPVPEGVFILSLDITRHKQAEEELRESEEFTRAVMDHLPIGVAVNSVDPEVDFSYMNDNFPRFYRTTREALADPDTFWQAAYEDPEFRNHIRTRVLDDCASGDPERMHWEDVPITRMGLETAYVSARNTPIPGKKLMISTVIDVTDRKRAQQEVERHRDHLEEIVEERTRKLKRLTLEQQVILDTAPAMIWFKDAQNNLIHVNKAAAEFDAILKETAEKSLTVLPPEDFESYQDDLEVIHTGIPRLGIIETRNLSDGKKVWLRTDKSPYLDENGQVAGLVVLSVDITDRVYAEQELERYSTQLEAANKELEAFAYSVSHDLRAPLRSIDGFSEAFLEDYGYAVDEQGKDYLRRVRAGAQRMAELIDDLLKLSRITRWEIQRRKVDLSALALEIIEHLKESEPNREINVMIEEGLVGEGDERLLRIVLENLLGNAWKFSRGTADARIEFGKKLNRELEKRNAELPNDVMVYFVRDTGVGFDMAYAKKLFGAFQRLHSITEFEGTGIGLATVQRAIHRHGGRVWADGQVGIGATFYFTLKILGGIVQAKTERL